MKITAFEMTCYRKRLFGHNTGLLNASLNPERGDAADSRTMDAPIYRTYLRARKSVGTPYTLYMHCTPNLVGWEKVNNKGDPHSQKLN